MQILPFVREGPGNSSYLVQVAEREALLIDRDRSIDRYLQAASEGGWHIVCVLETHLHADFVSGAREAGYVTGAPLYVPEQAQAQFPHRPVKPGQRLSFGDALVESLPSPGHTPEHLSYVLRAERSPEALFSGGALIVGGAARTDLIAPDMTDSLTRAQFRTLKTAFSHLPDETLLYPTHGGGSFCSVGAGGARHSTLGAERSSNPLLAVDDEEEFVRWLPSTFPAAPAYFFRMRPINQAGPRLRKDVPLPPPLTPEEFDAARKVALVVDVRPFEDFARAHIPGALSNTFRDVFATWLGWLVPDDVPLLFVTGDAPVERVVDEAMLVGCERFAGWLQGGMDAWTQRGLPVSSFEIVDGPQGRGRAGPMALSPWTCASQASSARDT